MPARRSIRLVHACTYPVAVLDYDGSDGRQLRPKRRPGAHGSVVQVRRAGGVRYLPRLTVAGRTRDVPGGARLTRSEAAAALEAALAITRPCGADTFGDDVRCYWHGKLDAPLEVNGHESADGWRPVMLATPATFDPLEHRPAPPEPRCIVCGQPTRIGERGPVRYCSSACKATAYARRHGARARLDRLGRQLVAARRGARA
jgi:hypothetical protein